jgi:hypothetical protein
MVHGLVQTVGSLIVVLYSSVFASTRVQRSTTCRFSRDPRNSTFGLKLVTSTTRVLPSQWPRASPCGFTCAGKWKRNALAPASSRRRLFTVIVQVAMKPPVGHR